MKKLFSKAFACMATLAVATAAFAVPASATQAEIEATPVTLHIQQQEMTLEELQAADYKVTVSVYCSGATYGIDSWNPKFLYFADCEPNGYDALATDSEVANGGVMTLNARTGIKSDNFSLDATGLTGNPVGVVQVLGYTSAPVYNDHYENENPEDVTFFTMTFTLPEDTAEGDLFNIKWWEVKNLENEKNDDIALGDYCYITNWEDGFIKITDPVVTTTTTTTTTKATTTTTAAATTTTVAAATTTTVATDATSAVATTTTTTTTTTTAADSSPATGVKAPIAAIALLGVIGSAAAVVIKKKND